MANKTIHIDNTGNISEMVDCQVILKLMSSNFDSFSALRSDGSDIYFTDNGTILNHFINYINIQDEVGEIFIKVSCPAESYKNITMQYGGDQHVGDYDRTMTPKQPGINTLAIFKNGLSDSLNYYKNFNSTAVLETIRVGEVLSLDGITSYATNSDILKYINGQFIPINNFRLYNFFSCFAFNFILKETHIAGSGIKTIFHKYYDSNNYIEFGLNNTGQFYCTYRCFSGSQKEVHWTSNETIQYKDKINSFSLRISPDAILIHVNNQLAITSDLIGSMVGIDLTFGCYNNGTKSQFANIYLFNISVHNGFYPLSTELAENLNIKTYGRIEPEKWVFVNQYPKYPTTDIEIGESSLLSFNNKLCWFIKVNDMRISSAQVSQLVLFTSEDEGITWDTGTILFGAGIGGENYGVYRPFVFFSPVDSKLHCIYSRFTVAGVWYGNYMMTCESVDGLTWTNYTQILTGSRSENTCVIYDNSKWVGMAEAGYSPGVWVSKYMEGTTLLNLTVGINDLITSMRCYANNTFGGPFLVKKSGVYHGYTQQTANNGMGPSVMMHAIANSMGDNSFVLKYPHEVFTLNKQYADDQRADIHICEHNNKSFIVVSDYANWPTLKSIISIYKYDGTLDQLFTDTTVIIL